MPQALPGRAGARAVRLRAAFAAAGLLSLLFTAPRSAAAQATGTVHGSVTETGTGKPMVGAQVSIKGTTHGSLTDASGNYTIAGVPAGPATIRVESIGFKTIEQAVTVAGGQTATANFQLQQSAIGLDEIVVTGTAGRTAKRAVGNSVGSIKAATITQVAPIDNVQQLIQGRTPGVTLLASTGVVGGSSRIRIRGAGSINAGNDPVVYVDGIRIQSGTQSTEGNTAQGISMLESINPADIESIEVIKGPAAATLYGAEAAAGVLQIITKKGRPAEGLQWTANMEYGQVDWNLDQPTTYWLCTDSNIDNAVTYPGCQVFSKSDPLDKRILVDHPFDMGNRSPGVYKQLQDKGLPTDHFACLFPQQTPCQPNPIRVGDLWNGNMSVRGGGQSYNFYMSGEKSDEQGTFYNNINRRTAGRANFGFVPSQQLNFAVNVGYALLDQRIPQSDNSSNSILRNSFRARAGAANDQFLPGYRNFIPELSNKYDRDVKAERLTLGITTNYNPWRWFQNRLVVGLDRNDRSNRTFNQIDQTGLAPFGANAATGTVSIDYPLQYLWTVDYSGTVTANLSQNYTSTFSTGMQLNKRRSSNVGISGQGLVSNSLNLVSAAATRSSSQSFSEQTSLGFYVQEQVGFKDRLFGTAAVRVDDNSAFGKDFSLVVYPKASLSYVISEESFFHVPWINELKLRGAWGQAGNAPAPFSADRTYTSDRSVVGDAAVNTVRPSAYGNPNLKAETGQEIELGYDASLFGGRVSTEFTYYNKSTKDALIPVSDPRSSGFSGTHLINVGEINNHGVELSVDASPVRKPNLQWDVIATFASNHNKLVSFGTDAQGNPTLNELTFGEFASVQRHREGYPLGGYWATDVQRDASGNPILNANGAATTVTCIWDVQHPENCGETYVGPMLPTRQVGLTNTLNLLGALRLYAFLDYQGGQYQWCALCSVRTRIDQNTQQINDPNLDPVQKAVLLSLQTKTFIMPADFLKLRELSATYTLPRRWTSRYGFSRAAITVSGRNLWLSTKYKGSADPEVAFTSTADFTTLDYASIPQLRRWLISMAFNF